jgi:ADP-ribose pyrophosphatase YjhB (NUDIX family)
MKRFNGPHELANWLRAHGIDTRIWGTGQYKTVANLWEEYESREISFEDNPPRRKVSVVQILVRRGNMILLEIEQAFANGERRFRSQPPSEKVKANETIMDAARRGLKEELGIRPDQIGAISPASKQEEIMIDSPSYPGLVTRYTMQTVAASVDGLPAEDFWRDNRAFSKGDPVHRHLWGWREPG